MRQAASPQAVHHQRSWWRELRVGLSLSLEDVVRDVGWSLTRSWLEDYERGEGELPLSTREALREYYQRKLGDKHAV
jgi:transcriptional regulator with XRE-family HTH domain